MGIIAAMTDLVLSTHLAPRPHAASQLVTCWTAQKNMTGAGYLLVRVPSCCEPVRQVQTLGNAPNPAPNRSLSPASRRQGLRSRERAIRNQAGGFRVEDILSPCILIARCNRLQFRAHAALWARAYIIRTRAVGLLVMPTPGACPRSVTERTLLVLQRLQCCRRQEGTCKSPAQPSRDRTSSSG